ncbi:MAG: sensor histidine kinase [Ancalomicrobiaceae bacterium]|nr:sensor histidine kinase [Ancalomicrobiaceae bacterium]
MIAPVRSLRLRLAAGAAGALVIALVVAGFGLALLFEHHTARRLAEDLDLDLRQLAGGLEVTPSGTLTLSRSPADPRFADPLSGLYWQVFGNDGTLLRSRSLWDTSLQLPTDRPRDGEVHQHRIVGPNGTELIAAERIVQIAKAPGGGALRLVVAADMTGVRAARDAFSLELIPALGLVAVVLALAGWVQIGLGLRPLSALSRGVAAVRNGIAPKLDSNVPREVQPLVDELNALLDAQARDLERARRRAADLAHGLKTPLAALAGDVERLVSRGEAEIAADIAGIAVVMRRHVDRELARIRVNPDPLQRARADVAAVTRLLVETLRRTPKGEPLAFEIAVPPAARAPIDADDLTELLGNLIDNAVRHAHTRVRIVWAEIEGGASLTVTDDGPGIAEADRLSVLKRGTRLDESTPGTGLGLAIAHDIVSAYGHTLDLDRADIGGLAVAIRFRPAVGTARSD